MGMEAKDENQQPRLNAELLLGSLRESLRQTKFRANALSLTIDIEPVVSKFAELFSSGDMIEGSPYGGNVFFNSHIEHNKKNRTTVEAIVDDIVSKIDELGWAEEKVTIPFTDPKVQITDPKVQKSPPFLTGNITTQKGQGKILQSEFHAHGSLNNICMFSRMNRLFIENNHKELKNNIIEAIKREMADAGYTEKEINGFEREIKKPGPFQDDFKMLETLINEKSAGKIKMHSSALYMRHLANCTNGLEKELVASFLGIQNGADEQNAAPIIASGKSICRRLAERMNELLSMIYRNSDFTDAKDLIGIHFPKDISYSSRFIGLQDMDSDSNLLSILPIVPQHSSSIEEHIGEEGRTFVFSFNVKKNGKSPATNWDEVVPFRLKKILRNAIESLAPDTPDSKTKKTVVEKKTAKTIARDFIVYFYCLYNIHSSRKSLGDMEQTLRNICVVLKNPQKFIKDDEKNSNVEFFLMALAKSIFSIIISPVIKKDENFNEAFYAEIFNLIKNICRSKTLKERNDLVSDLLSKVNKLYDKSLLKKSMSELGVFMDATENIVFPRNVFSSSNTFYLSLHRNILNLQGIENEEKEIITNGRVFSGTENNEDGIIGNWYQHLRFSQDEPKSDIVHVARCRINFEPLHMVRKDKGADKLSVERIFELENIDVLPVFVCSQHGKNFEFKKGKKQEPFFQGKHVIIHNVDSALSEATPEKKLGFNLLMKALALALSKIVKRTSDSERIPFLPLVRLHVPDKSSDANDSGEIMRIACIQSSHMLNSISVQDGESSYFLSNTQGYEFKNGKTNFNNIERESWRHENAPSDLFTMLPKRFVFQANVFEDLQGERIAIFVMSSSKTETIEKRDKKSVVFGKVLLVDVVDSQTCTWSFFRSFQYPVETEVLYGKSIKIVEDIYWELGKIGVTRTFHITKPPFSDRIDDDSPGYFTNPDAVKKIKEHHFAAQLAFFDSEKSKKKPCHLTFYPCHCLDFTAYPNAGKFTQDDLSFFCDNTANQISEIYGKKLVGRVNQPFFSISSNISVGNKSGVWEMGENIRLNKRKAKHINTYIVRDLQEPGETSYFTELTSDEISNSIRRGLLAILTANHLANWGKNGTVCAKKNPYEDIFQNEDSVTNRKQKINIEQRGLKLIINLFGLDTDFFEIAMPVPNHRKIKLGVDSETETKESDEKDSSVPQENEETVEK